MIHTGIKDKEGTIATHRMEDQLIWDCGDLESGVVLCVCRSRVVRRLFNEKENDYEKHYKVGFTVRTQILWV